MTLTGCPNVGTGLTIGDTVLPSFFFTANLLVQGLLDVVDVGGGSGLLDVGGLLDDLTGGLRGILSSDAPTTTTLSSSSPTTTTLTTDTERLVDVAVPDQAVDPGGEAVAQLTKLQQAAPSDGAAKCLQKALDKVGAAGQRLNVQKVNPLSSDTSTDDTAGASGKHRPAKDTVTVKTLPKSWPRQGP